MSAYIVDRVTFSNSTTTSTFALPAAGGFTTMANWNPVGIPLQYNTTPEETVSVKVFEYIVIGRDQAQPGHINAEADPSVIVAGPTCIVAECADEARVAAGQATAGLAIPASSLKVLVRQFA